MPEAKLYQDGCSLDFTPVAAATGGEVVQLRDGRAGVIPSDVAAGALGAAQAEGVYTVTKTANIVILDGGKVYWDHSANAAHFKPVNDKDFYLGVAIGDAASSATTVKVAINVEPRYLIDSARDEFTCAIVKTAGTPSTYKVGGSQYMDFSATAEAQKIDMLSDRAFAVAANAIVEFKFRAIDDGDASAIDLNIGIANATHASDADAITESVFVHCDGNSTQVNLESDDGTTEVAATDSTIDYTLGTAHEVWMDLRDPSDIQIYIDGVLMLGSTVFTLAAATGPMKLLAHLEKSSDDTPGQYVIDFLRARIAEQ